MVPPKKKLGRVTLTKLERRRFYILGDPGADSGGEGKSKRAEKYGTKKSKERREELFSPFFTFRLQKNCTNKLSKNLGYEMNINSMKLSNI